MYFTPIVPATAAVANAAVFGFFVAKLDTVLTVPPNIPNPICNSEEDDDDFVFDVAELKHDDDSINNSNNPAIASRELKYFIIVFL
mmetsp:Transcript_28771/g.32896  ORF Transcript_28771/g.32896 Transcript_28771/m.32896 type:complete len:86 (+) Transcript_28771:1023-1280(+)